jgi:hypothetical protein
VGTGTRCVCTKRPEPTDPPKSYLHSSGPGSQPDVGGRSPRQVGLPHNLRNHQEEYTRPSFMQSSLKQEERQAIRSTARGPNLRRWNPAEYAGDGGRSSATLRSNPTPHNREHSRDGLQLLGQGQGRRPKRTLAEPPIVENGPPRYSAETVVMVQPIREDLFCGALNRLIAGRIEVHATFHLSKESQIAIKCWQAMLCLVRYQETRFTQTLESFPPGYGRRVRRRLNRSRPHMEPSE